MTADTAPAVAEHREPAADPPPVALAAVVDQLLAEDLLSETWVARAGDQQPRTIGREHLIDGIRRLAEQHGIDVADGWHGAPVVTAADADRIVAMSRQAAADQAAREAADFAASADWERAQRESTVPGQMTLSEMAGFLGPNGMARALGPGGTGLPVVVAGYGRNLPDPARMSVAERLAYERSAAPQAAALLAAQQARDAPKQVAGPTRDDGW